MMNKYRQMESLVDRFGEFESAPEKLDEISRLVRTELDSIAKLEKETSGIKEQYRSTRPHASEQVKKTTQQLAGIIERVLMKISTFEQQLQRSRDLLLPQISEGVRAVQMKDAYRKNA
jgi:archaellum component FlaC